MKVAFTIFGGDSWTGGVNYLRNLLSAIAELPEGSIEPILFHAPEADLQVISMLTPFLKQPPIVVHGWSGSLYHRAVRLFGSAFLQRDRVSEVAFRRAGVDVVFQHAAWYGLLFPLPTLAWIADFQHKHLPNMFTKVSYIKRDLGFMALSRCATRIMVSSNDARADAERFFPASRGRISVLPFCVQVNELAQQIAPKDVQIEYGLPARYFYLPNQFWKHKNHLGIIEALRILTERGVNIVIAVSGNPKDSRNPDYPATVLDLVSSYGLEKSFRLLGLIPYEHIAPLMRGSLAVINPSFFEGWSTTVEEAKSLGVPLLLSDLGVHREQANDCAVFFDAYDPESIADCLAKKWSDIHVNDQDQHLAINRYREKRIVFANTFLEVILQTKKLGL